MACGFGFRPHAECTTTVVSRSTWRSTFPLSTRFVAFLPRKKCSSRVATHIEKREFRVGRHLRQRSSLLKAMRHTGQIHSHRIYFMMQKANFLQRCTLDTGVTFRDVGLSAESCLRRCWLSSLCDVRSQPNLMMESSQATASHDGEDAISQLCCLTLRLTIPDRVGHAYTVLQHELWTGCHIRISTGKTQVWNSMGELPAVCDMLERIAHESDQRARVWRGSPQWNKG